MATGSTIECSAINLLFVENRSAISHQVGKQLLSMLFVVWFLVYDFRYVNQLAVLVLVIVGN